MSGRVVIINPGSGPVAGATVDHAYTNMAKLLEDSGCGPEFHRDPDPKSEDGDGRFAFLVPCAPSKRHPRGRDVSVLMPGIPLERVRYMGEPRQRILDFPRLYVDGNSWVWEFAIDALRREVRP